MAEQSYEQMRAQRLEELKKNAERRKHIIEQLQDEHERLREAQKTLFSKKDSVEAKSQIDLDHRIKEAKQGQLFRNCAFGFSCVLWGGVAYVWFKLFNSWPEPTKDYTPPVQLYYLWGMKTSLATVLLIAVTLGVMRFALRCYGYHHLQEGKKESSDSDEKNFLDLVKAFNKDQPSE